MTPTRQSTLGLTQGHFDDIEAYLNQLDLSFIGADSGFPRRPRGTSGGGWGWVIYPGYHNLWWIRDRRD